MHNHTWGHRRLSKLIQRPRCRLAPIAGATVQQPLQAGIGPQLRPGWEGFKARRSMSSAAALVCGRSRRAPYPLHSMKEAAVWLLPFCNHPTVLKHQDSPRNHVAHADATRSWLAPTQPHARTHTLSPMHTTSRRCCATHLTLPLIGTSSSAARACCIPRPPCTKWMAVSLAWVTTAASSPTWSAAASSGQAPPPAQRSVHLRSGRSVKGGNNKQKKPTNQSACQLLLPPTYLGSWPHSSFPQKRRHAGAAGRTLPALGPGASKERMPWLAAAPETMSERSRKRKGFAKRFGP